MKWKLMFIILLFIPFIHALCPARTIGPTGLEPTDLAKFSPGKITIPLKNNLGLPVTFFWSEEIKADFVDSKINIDDIIIGKKYGTENASLKSAPITIEPAQEFFMTFQYSGKFEYFPKGDIYITYETAVEKKVGIFNIIQYERLDGVGMDSNQIAFFTLLYFLSMVVILHIILLFTNKLIFKPTILKVVLALIVFGAITFVMTPVMVSECPTFYNQKKVFIQSLFGAIFYLITFTAISVFGHMIKK